MKRKPVLALLSLFAGICIALTACQKEYSVEILKLGAEGSLQDSTGECLLDSAVGTYYGGVEPGRDTAYILVKVNITKAGSYTIYTDQQDGIYFSDSGYFTATGINTIKLKPIGTPIIPGAYGFNVNFDSTVCSFNLTIQDSTGTGLGGHTGGGGGGGTTGSDTWQFTSTDGTFTGGASGSINSVAGFNILSITGTTTGDSLFSMSLQLPSIAPPTSGTFNTSTAASANTFSFTGLTGTIYEADVTTSGVAVVITITSYDATTKELKGTFTGNAKATSGNVAITSGSFDVILP